MSQPKIKEHQETVYLESLGCAKNQVDSEIMLGTLLKNGIQLVTDPKLARYIVINTCGFLSSAVSESIERILLLSRYKESGVCEKLIVAGCLSTRYCEGLLQEIPEIDGIIGTSDYTTIIESIRGNQPQSQSLEWVSQKPSYSENNYKVERQRVNDAHYAYLKIAEGCSNTCSFCNIPQLRGPFHSRPIESIQTEFLQLVDSGVKEINLISQDTSSYGIDFPGEVTLYHLVQQLLASSDADFWLRIFYVYPNRFPAQILRLMQEDKRLVPYLDMPFQHISDKVLKKMNRKITRQEIEAIVTTIFNQVPELSLRSSFIVGFPNEEEQDFQELLEFVEQGIFEHIGVFTYSAEDNARSYGYGDPVPQEEKERRKTLLLEAQQKVLYQKNRERVGKKVRVLIDGLSEETDLLLQGRTACQGVEVDGKVLVNEGKANQGDFHLVEITEAHPYDLVGKIVSE